MTRQRSVATIDRRNIELSLMFVWSGFLLWLWVSGEVLRYLGPRTSWVALAGAAALAAVAAVYARTIPQESHPARPSARELLGAAALLMPIAVAMLMSGASLGSAAASKKMTVRGVDVAALARSKSDSGEVGLLELYVADESHEYADQHGVVTGERVNVTGFVLKPSTHEGGDFTLARFYLSCCVADAVPVSIRVHQPAAMNLATKKDTWLVVTGEVERTSSHVSLQALDVKTTKEPKAPYMSFR
jgi:uncharacterized repeat protein (TIGR03943 family)